MGNGAEYLAGKRRGNDSEYVSIGPSKIVNGIKGTLLKRRNGSDTHSNLPEYANTSDVYFRQNKNGVCQARVYSDGKMSIDFDWSHRHCNTSTDGQVFERGIVHVQTWIIHKDGSKERMSENARPMSYYEIATYGPLIKAFCPDVKFR